MAVLADALIELSTYGELESEVVLSATRTIRRICPTGEDEYVRRQMTTGMHLGKGNRGGASERETERTMLGWLRPWRTCILLHTLSSFPLNFF
jgi:hypothetical protein